MKKLLPLITLFFALNTFSQKEANFWYFGRNAGIDFNTTPPSPITNGAINTLEGCSSFADSAGNLLFYTDGITVWNKNDQIMSYSDGSPANNLRGNPSSTQSGMIIPKPGSTSIYYLFTVGDNQNPAFDLYTIDMSLNAGLGELIDENNNGNFSEDLASQATANSNNWTEKVAAVRGKDCNTYWIVTKVSNFFYSYKIDENGVNLTPVISTVTNNTSRTRGYLKLSPDGKRLAIANQNTNNDLLLYSFDNETGFIANDGISIFNDVNDGEAYGVEFSRNSEKLYVSSTSGFRATLADTETTYKLFQYNLTATDIEASKVLIHEQIGYRGALQLGPDGKIYATIPLAYDDTDGDATFLDVIENPNTNATDVIFTKDAISLGGQKSTQGLPPFISSLLLPIDIEDNDTGEVINDQDLQFCTGDNKTITPANNVTGTSITYEWIFDDGTTTSTVSTSANLILNNLTLNDSGKYTLTIELTDDCGNVTQLEGTFNIGVFDAAAATKPSDINFCDTDRDGFNSFNLQVDKASDILNSLDPNTFDVLYFTSMADATANVAGTALANPYTNPTAFSSQTIYARVHNKNAPNACFAITDFQLTVTDLPIPQNPTEYRVCDNTSIGSDTDGFVNDFILSTKDVQILGALDPLQFNVSYHTTLAGAQSDATTDVIDKTTNYTNTTINTQQIFVRVENKDNTTCFDASKSFNIVVSPLPIISSTVELKQCDNDTDGFSNFNLNEAASDISPDYLNETFTFFPTLADANANSNAFSDPLALTFSNRTVNTDTVWARATTAFGCYRVSEVTLTVSTTGIPDTFQRVFTQCDDFLDLNGNDTSDNSDIDGVSSFDFSSVTPEVIALFPAGQQLTVTYYRNQADALAEINTITDIRNYRNIGYPNSQEIYIRVDSNLDNDCLGFGTHITLNVNPVPTAQTIQNLEECDNSDDGSGINGIIQSFNLEEQTPAILGTQNPTEFTVTYYDSAENANSATDPLTSPYTNTTRDAQTIFVRVTNNTTECFTDHTSFNIIVNPLPIANFAEDIEVCDDNLDGSARNGFSQNIDLQSRTADILGDQDPTLFSVSYHASLDDAQTDTRRLLSPFSNTIPNRQTIFIRVFNQTNQCTNGISNFDVIVNAEPLANPDNTLSNLSLCDTDLDGDDMNGLVEDIDFNIQIPTILGATQDPDDFNVSFHLNQTDATDGTNPLPTPYSNTTREETIFVRIENKATGCVNDDLTFLLIVKELPRFSVTGEDPDNPQILCLNYTTPYTVEAEDPAGDYTYQWTDSTGNIIGTDQSLIISAGGEYTIKATDITTTCQRQRTIFVKESEKATLQESLITIIDESNAIGSENNISIAIDTENGVLGKGDYQFAIFNTDDTTRIPSIGFQEEPLFENLEGGVYTVIVNDKNGCVQDETFTISVIQFPKFFTPNGDGKNDTWVVKGANKTFYPNSSINIFNRFGKLVAQVPIDSQGWNGMYNGKILPSDDYWFNIQLIPADESKSPINKKGNFSLLRK